MAKKYLRKKDVAARYGGVTPRWVELAVADGRLPKPIYFGTRFPAWDEAALDAADRRAMSQPRQKIKVPA
jgi:predicted DNA-binding transcriptional regulator AlpA